MGFREARDWPSRLNGTIVLIQESCRPRPCNHTAGWVHSTTHDHHCLRFGVVRRMKIKSSVSPALSCYRTFYLFPWHRNVLLTYHSPGYRCWCSFETNPQHSGIRLHLVTGCSCNGTLACSQYINSHTFPYPSLSPDDSGACLSGPPQAVDRPESWRPCIHVPTPAANDTSNVGSAVQRAPVDYAADREERRAPGHVAKQHPTKATGHN